MQRKKRGLWSVLLLLVLVVTVVAACSSNTSPETSQDASGNISGGEGQNSEANTESDTSEGIEPVTLKTAIAWSANDINSRGYQMFVEKAQELSGGAITFDFKGGPEAVPPFDQGEAVRNGVLDIAVLSASYYIPQIPEAAALDYTELASAEERESGALEYLNEIHHEKMGVHILGRANDQKYSLYTKTPVSSLEDFKGLRIRVSATYLPFVKALGAEPITMPAGEVYQALEKGVIDGFAWPEAGIIDLGWHELVKYKISPAFWKIDSIGIINYDTWQSLSPEAQDILTQAFQYVESEIPEEVQAYIAEEEKVLEEKGIEFVQLPEEEYLQIANDAGWEWIKENSPEHGESLEKLFRK